MNKPDVIVLGIDAGGFNTPSWLAFLQGDQFTLSMAYLRRRSLALPWLQSNEVAAIAVDAPQGLPNPSRSAKVRACDRAAGTPTKRLPITRMEMERGAYDDGKKVAYQSVIHLGVDLFWYNRSNLYKGGSAKNKILEIYPRAILQALVGKSIPSKRRQPVEYGQLVVEVMRELGLCCPGVIIPSDDQADAMLCAYTARCALEGRIEVPGEAPHSDKEETVIREGYIVLPEKKAADGI